MGNRSFWRNKNVRKIIQKSIIAGTILTGLYGCSDGDENTPKIEKTDTENYSSGKDSNTLYPSEKVDSYFTSDSPSEITPSCSEKIYYKDFDKDTFGNLYDSTLSCVPLPNYVKNSSDCDDTDKNTYPGAPELCDNKDNNCNMIVDDKVQFIKFYKDGDKDGFGSGTSIVDCKPSDLYTSTTNTDCNDNNLLINPSAVELCDGIDNNCNGNTDEKYTLGNTCSNGIGTCKQEGKYICKNDLEQICDAIPGKPQNGICNCSDNNCDGKIDCDDLKGKILFSANTTSTTDFSQDIFVSDANGCNIKNLTNYPDAEDSHPSWSPDAKKIVFISNRIGTSGIYVMNADGTEQKKISNKLEYFFPDNIPSWSPDGKKIIFEDNGQIQIMNADGSEQKALTKYNPSSSMYYNNPVFSPDGKKIAFDSSFENYSNDKDIGILDVVSGKISNLTNYPNAADSFPVWSPDGSKIAFTSNRTGNIKIYVMNADGSGQTKIDNNLLGDNSNPIWSPDGKKIVYRVNVVTNSQIYLMNANGTDNKLAINFPINIYCNTKIDWK